MGMSASQARLLSITGRLTNNEFRAQLLTNDKLRLATETTQATKAYNEALDSEKLMYMNYDDKGDATKIALTPAVLYDYAPMKNQYLIQNSSGKFLVSNADIENFENKNNLFEFLQCYDLVYDSYSAQNQKIKDDWQANRDKLYAEYEKEHKEWEYIRDNWNYGTTDTTLYDKFHNIIGDSQNPLTDCYREGLLCDGACYLHVLNYLLEYDGTDPTKINCTTSSGDNFKTTGIAGFLARQIGDYPDKKNTMHELSLGIEDLSITCDGADEFTPYYNNDNVNDKLEGNIIQSAIDEGRRPTKYEILKSDYIYDSNTNKCIGKKSLKQKLIDLYYIILCSNDSKLIRDGYNITDSEINPSNVINDMRNMLINFTEGDLKMVSRRELPPEPIWKEPDPPQLVEGLAFLRDQEKSQWYTNLWHAMNGSKASNTVDPINFDNDVDFIEKIPQEIRNEYRFIVENKTKDTKTTNYVSLDKNLFESSEWLEFALGYGVVSLVQAQYYNPDEDSKKVANINADGFGWTPIIHTSATDIVSVPDDDAVTRAEVEYKKTLKSIKAKDKKYDSDLKKLDTEHSALMAEYDAIKETISKNVQRSFKMFS